MFTKIMFFLLSCFGQLLALDCSSRVVDQAGVFGDKIGSVAFATSRLLEKGADSYVRTFNTFGSAGDIEKFSRQLAAQCPSWQDARGDYKSNLVLVVFTTKERKINIALGVDYFYSIKPRFSGIVDREIGPSFRNKDFAGGMVKGLNSIESLLPNSFSQKSQRTQTNVLLDQSPKAPSKPINWAILWYVLGFLFFGGVAWILFCFLSDRVQLKDAVKKLRQQVIENKESAANCVQDLPEHLNLLKNRAELLLLQIRDREVEIILANMPEFQELLDSLILKYRQLTDEYAHIWDEGLLDKEEYERMFKLFDGLNKQFAELTAELKHIDNQLTEKEIAVKGLDDKAKTLGVELDMLRQRIVESRGLFEQMTSLYARKSWESVVGNGSEAELIFIECEKLLPLLQLALESSPKNTAGAFKLCGKITDSLKQAHSLLNSITTIADNLKQAKRRSGEEIVFAEQGLLSAAEFEHVHDADVDDSVKAELARGRTLIAQAKELLQIAQPDYFEIINLANQVKQLATDLLAQCKREHEVADLLRSQISSLRQSVRARIEKAREYHQDKKGYVTQEAASMLELALSCEGKISFTTVGSEILELLKKADEAAKKAYKLVRKNFEDNKPRVVRKERSSYPSSAGTSARSLGSSNSGRTVTHGHHPHDRPSVYYDPIPIFGGSDGSSSASDDDNRRVKPVSSDTFLSYDSPSPDPGPSSSDSSSDW